MTSYADIFHSMGLRAQDAARQLAILDTEKKNRALRAMAQALANDEAAILLANGRDVAQAKQAGLSSAMVDRLRLDAKRIASLVDSVAQVCDLPDPIGQVLRSFDRPNGLHIEQRRVPLGVIAMIYEARPNVTVDASILALKTGNAIILRGGKEALATNQALVAALQKGLRAEELPAEAVQLIDVTDREAVAVLLQERATIDVVIPRGGAGLIRRVVTESAIPVIETGSGICHIYIDEAADMAKAAPILANAKTQRPSVCNAVETVIVHRNRLQDFVKVGQDLRSKAVRLIGDQAMQEVLGTEAGTEENWATEYNDLVLNCVVVDSLDEAVAHIRRYGTKHSECIVTEDEAAARRFMSSVDASTVYHNASTRFTDGFEFGFGAEIGISTQKLHARGPMGLEALTSYTYYVYGDGQVRE